MKHEDIYYNIASRMYQIPIEEVTPEMRREAKRRTFGIIYGEPIAAAAFIEEHSTNSDNQNTQNNEL